MPFNGDRRLVETVITDHHREVRSFYGSLSRDGLGGGRILTPEHAQTVADLSPIIKLLSRNAIEFNYVVSGPHSLNREFNPDFQRSYLDFVSSLRGIGISIITLANLTLIELTRERFPDLRVSASINLRSRTPQDVSYLLGLGCQEITLHFDVYKDPQALAAIRALTEYDLKLIPNDIFIMSCPWHKPHTRMQAAHTRAKGFETPYFNYYRNKCVNLRHHKPDEIYKAMWIAPSILDSYEHLGYDYFKLLDRYATTDWNLRALRAYLQRSDSSLELVLGTYGAPSSSTAPEPCDANDRPYPTQKLEVIPSISARSPSSKAAFQYFLDPRHPQECGSCALCGQAATSDLSFPQEYRAEAIENNRKWQDKITKIEFIRSLQGYARDRGYQ